jgi:hypothetical protein
MVGHVIADQSSSEKEEATTHRVMNPPLSKCEYRLELATPPPGLDYTPFWCCPILLSVITHKRCLFPCCDESFDFIYITLTYNVICKVTSEHVISMNLFTVLGVIG